MNFAGATNYRNFSNKDIWMCLEKLKKYSRDISREDINKIDDNFKQADLMGVYADIISFSFKFLEGTSFNILRLKLNIPSLFFIKKLKKMGIDAHDLNNNIGKIWHQNEYSSRYADTILKEKYAKLRDYIIAMEDINSIGIELENRHYDDGKIIKENNIWKYFLDFWESTIRGLFK